MKTTGYSGKPVWQKLGIEPDSRIHLVDAPADYAELVGWTGSLTTTAKAADIIHCFATSRASLQKVLPALIQKVAEGGCIWISWYKKSAGIQTDLTEDIIREIILPTGWVDVKVCSVSEQWSGLKFLRRKK
ncbi:MAG: hypothetical protein ACN4EP_02025 [Sediminibacterium sp.]